jgi:hypothetical protein
MQAVETPKLINIAAKMLDRRKPSRTRTESEAQPMAEKIAVISASRDMGAKMWEVQINPRPDNLQPQEFVMKRRVLIDRVLHNPRDLT